MHRSKLHGCLGIALALVASGCSNNDSPPPAATPAPGNDASAIAGSGASPTSPTAAETLPRVAGWDENAPSKGSCSLDAVNGINPMNATFQVDSLNEATFDGWSATSDLQSPKEVRVYLIGFGKFELRARVGISREDVAAAYGAGLGASGFEVEAARMLLPPGKYKVFIGATSTNLGLEICDAGSIVEVREPTGQVIPQ